MNRPDRHGGKPSAPSQRHANPTQHKETIVGIAPAQPGYNIITLSYWDDGSIHGYCRDPVIAWVLYTTGMVIPATVDGFDEFIPSSVPVECPDGRLRSFEFTWESIDQWFAQMKEEAQNG